MSTLIKKENRDEWLSNKSAAYINGWSCCEAGNKHLEFDRDINNLSKSDLSDYTRGYSQCFSNQACIDNK